MKFPVDYPYSPPSIRFMTKVWHPNVYEVSERVSLFSFFPPSVPLCTRERATVIDFQARRSLARFFFYPPPRARASLWRSTARDDAPKRAAAAGVCLAVERAHIVKLNFLGEYRQTRI